MPGCSSFRPSPGRRTACWTAHRCRRGRPRRHGCQVTPALTCNCHVASWHSFSPLLPPSLCLFPSFLGLRFRAYSPLSPECQPVGRTGPSPCGFSLQISLPSSSPLNLAFFSKKKSDDTCTLQMNVKCRRRPRNNPSVRWLSRRVSSPGDPIFKTPVCVEFPVFLRLGRLWRHSCLRRRPHQCLTNQSERESTYNLPYNLTAEGVWYVGRGGRHVVKC